MPTNTSYYCGFYESNPQLWAQCLDEAKKTMLASGWVVHAREFFTVQSRKSKMLFKVKSK